MPIAINEFEAIADAPAAVSDRRDAASERRPVEPQRMVPALTRLHARARRTWAH
jgi:xanthine dehydrogenase molybdopterin-binding subunit B